MPPIFARTVRVKFPEDNPVVIVKETLPGTAREAGSPDMEAPGGRPDTAKEIVEGKPSEPLRIPTVTVRLVDVPDKTVPLDGVSVTVRSKTLRANDASLPK